MNQDHIEDECNCLDFADEEETSEMSKMNEKIIDVPQEFHYAPDITPRIINGTLYGIIIHWVDKLPDGNITFMTNSVANTYRRISSGNAQFRVFARTIRVNYKASPINVPKAEQQVIDEILKLDGDKKKGPRDYFLIVNGCTKVNHTSISRRICHLTSTLITTANHEQGHSLNIMHSNILKDGKIKSSLDGTSFMSIYSATNLTACQNYYLGWLNKMTALYDSTSVSIFKIYKFDGPYITGSIKAIILPGTNSYIFLSYPKFKDGNHLTLHTTYGETNLGSTRISVTGQIVYDYFYISKLYEDNNSVTVRISKTI